MYFLLLLRFSPLVGVSDQNSLSPECSVLGILRGDPQFLHVPSQSIYLPLGVPLVFLSGTIMSTIALTSLFSSILCMCSHQRSLISLTFSFMMFTPSSFLRSTFYTVSQCYTFNYSQHHHLCFLDNLFFLLSNCPTFCSTQSTGLLTVK